MLKRGGGSTRLCWRLLNRDCGNAIGDLVGLVGSGGPGKWVKWAAPLHPSPEGIPSHKQSGSFLHIGAVIATSILRGSRKSLIFPYG